MTYCWVQDARTCVCVCQEHLNFQLSYCLIACKLRVTNTAIDLRHLKFIINKVPVMKGLYSTLISYKIELNTKLVSNK